ncbi:hypothetical protein [Aliiroseovarius sp.]|uniref:hypothetical protein n=1 Tax=Aliiroseovarius sp. TaxID=1872442 RepID=UPI003BABFB31
MSTDENKCARIAGANSHPDIHQINDWFLHGPQNPRIEELVRELTLERGIRLSEVEELLSLALENKLLEMKS